MACGLLAHARVANSSSISNLAARLMCRQLECIEEVCTTHANQPDDLAQQVLKLLGADEDEIATASAALA